jgi:GAF domain-containing protein
MNDRLGDRLVGVFSAEDRDPMRFGEWHEAYLQISATRSRSASIA